ncbi:MAG: hypothetical protein H7Z13_06045 [Ferruginibacter sp.]|nr:hypothetical protein [Ferruginibacter sp.]
MKKTFTIFATAVLLTTVSFAQYNHPNDNDYGNSKGREIAVNTNHDRKGHGNERGTYYFSARERDMQLSSINREYYRKMESVRNKVFMGRSRKAELIHSLEFQRNAEIRSVIAKFNDRKNLFDRRDNRYHGHDKRNDW